MSTRITKQDFYAQVKHLEEVMGIKLDTNVWHKHFDVYTMGKENCSDELLVTSDTARDAVDQILAIKRALFVTQNRVNS